MRWRAGAWVVAGLLGVARPAVPDVYDDAERVAAAWRSAGASVAEGRPRLLRGGEHVPLPVVAGAGERETDECVTALVLSAPSVQFMLVGLDRSVPSVAGMLEHRVCGAERGRLEDARIEMSSPRGVVQVTIARSDEKLARAVVLLPRRHPGIVAPTLEVGPSPAPPSLEQRADAAFAHARATGAENVGKYRPNVDQDGVGRLLVPLAPGCHRLDVLGLRSSRGAAVDVDAQLRWVRGGGIVVEDQSNATDAQVSVCSGDRRLAMLTFAGPPPGSVVPVILTTWGLPAGLVADWPGRTRAAMASALRQLGISALPDTPVAQRLGISGTTRMPLPVEPASCYVLAVGAVNGEPTPIEVDVTLVGSHAGNRNGRHDDGIAATFCTTSDERAVARLDVGGSLVWIGALWRLGPAPEGPLL